MYADSIVSERLGLAAESLGFTPEYHTPEEIDYFDNALARKYNDAYVAAARAAQGVKEPQQAFQTVLQRVLCNPQDPKLNSDEVRFITNERALVMADAAYFLTRYYQILTDEGIIKRFKFRSGQKIFFNCTAEIEQMDLAIEILLAKARQLGMTTIVAGLLLLKSMFSHGVSSVAASADSDKTREMVQKILMAYDKLPWWLRTPYTKRAEGDKGYIKFGSIDSGIIFQHGTQTNPIAMGTTVVGYHLCLSGRTLVRIADSQVKPIAEILAGERALSENGRVVNIRSAWKSPRKSELTSEIYVWGTPTPLSCTRDHRVMTADGWRVASDIKQGDHLIYPVRPIARNPKPVTMPVFSKHQRWVRGENNARLEILDFEPTFAIGRLVGLYLAEGSIQSTPSGNSKAIYFSIHRDEVATVEAWCREVFGQELRQTLKRKTSKTAQVVLNRRGFAQWLIEHFGQKDSKRVSDIAWTLGEDFCRGLVYGYLYGDGHYAARDNSVYATSIRVAITIGIRELIASLGFGWGQIAYRVAGQFYNRNCQACWILTLAGTTAQSIRSAFGYTVHPTKEPRSVHWKWHPLGIAAEVSDTGDGFSEDFYDLEVDDQSHQFLTACGLVHNSEVASYGDPEDLIDNGLFKAVHPSPRIFGVLESTCKGDTGWWHDSYWDAKIGWPKGQSRLMALFLPFYCAEDMYPNETERRGHPAPDDWKPEPETRQMMAESMMYVQSNPVLAKVLRQDGRPWEMKRDQAYYWEWNFLSAKRKGTEKSWYQEMPHTDQAAFQGSFDNVFGKPLIAEIFTKRETRYDVFAITGQSIEERHEADITEVDYEEVRVPVKWKSIRGETFQWMMVPLLWREPFEMLSDIRDDESHMGKFFVYYPPEPGYDYSVGIDTSNGIGQDGTVIAVSRRGRHEQEQDVQVAEFRDNRVSHIEAFAWGAAICAYYSRYMNPEYGWNKPYRCPYISIEQVAAVGDTCQLQMRKMGFSRFHRMTRYDSRPARMRKKDATKDGWFTFSWSRPILTDTFVTLVQNDWYQINSPYTIWEADHWEVHYTGSGKDRFEHSEDSTDDGLFANALAAFCPNDTKSLANRTSKQFRAEDGQRPPKLELGPTHQHAFSRTPPALILPRPTNIPRVHLTR